MQHFSIRIWRATLSIFLSVQKLALHQKKHGIKTTFMKFPLKYFIHNYKWIGAMKYISIPAKFGYHLFFVFIFSSKKKNTIHFFCSKIYSLWKNRINGYKIKYLWLARYELMLHICFYMNFVNEVENKIASKECCSIVEVNIKKIA